MVKFALLLLVLVGCSSPAVEYLVVPADASTNDAGADPCHCAFHWSRGPEIITCYARGACDGGEQCAPVLPLTEEPACAFRP